MPDGLRYIGHATVLMDVAGARLLTDPVSRALVGHVRRIVPVPRIDPLLPLDGVLISHAHADHLDVPSLRRLAHRGRPGEATGLDLAPC